MSRTDGHAPYWTWAPWYEPSHDIYCENYISRHWQKVPKYPCNLPKRAVRHAPARIRSHRYGDMGQCTWEPVWPTWRESRWLWWGRQGHAPNWFVKHVWDGPERVRTRDQLGKMVKEYNATGELEDGDFANYPARHCARWLWD